MKDYYRFISIFLVSLISSGILALGETFNKDYGQISLTFEITSETTVSVTWIEVLDTENDLDIFIPESVEYNGLEYTITEFKYDNSDEFPRSVYPNYDYLYSQKYGKIKSIYFPYTMTSIGGNNTDGIYNPIYMSGYVGLKKIIIDNAEAVFHGFSYYDRKYIEEIDFGNSIIKVEECWGCSNLKKIRLPEYYVSCDFNECISLEEIEWVSNGNENYKNRYNNLGEFKNCTSLKEITIFPENISSSAFYGCTALEKVNIINYGTKISEKAFEGCTALKEIDLSKCRDINDRAFLDCSNLRKVCFPEQIWKLGNNVFQGCDNLEEITVVPGQIIDNKCKTLLTVQDNVLYSQNIDLLDEYEEIGYDLLYYSTRSSKLSLYPAGKKDTSYIVPEVSFGGVKTQLTEIAGGAFANNKYLEKVSVLSGQLKNQSTFVGCKALKEVEILPGGSYYKFLDKHENEIFEHPDSMIRIPYGTFKGCTTLEKVMIPDSYLIIGHAAFEGCTGMREINLPSELKIISDGAFTGCSSLKKLVIPDEVQEIGTHAFEGCKALETVVIAPNSHLRHYGAGAFLNCKSLKSIDFPVSLDSIGPNAFKECHSLPEIRIPDNVTKLGRWAYENCKNAKTISIGNGIKEVDNFTFWGCSGAERLEIGENVENIGQDAFTGLDNLKVIICNSMTPPDYPTGFSDEVKENATLYIPEGASAAYYNDSTWQPFTQADAVEEVILDDIKVTSQNVEAPDGVSVEIYTFSGHLVASGKGSFSMNLASGLYIVKTAGSVRKITLK